MEKAEIKKYHLYKLDAFFFNQQLCSKTVDIASFASPNLNTHG